MFNIISDKEKYLKNIQGVGMNSQFYTIPNLGSTIQPIVDYQFYNPWTGAIGPSFTTNYDQMSSINGNTLSTNNVNISAEIYNKHGIYIGLIGAKGDVEKVKRCLDLHISQLK